MTTGLLQHSHALSSDQTRRLLDTATGRRVRTAERYRRLALAPDQVTGVDCHLTQSGGRQIRGVGTVIVRTTVTEGHVVQASAYARLRPGRDGLRRDWSHYMAERGVIETLGATDAEHLATGFLTGVSPDDLDLTAIGNRAVDQVQSNSLLDREPPFQVSRTSLRWTIDDGPADSRAITFLVLDESRRTVRVRAPYGDAVQAAVLCEDIALHDWLLTTMLTKVAGARIGGASRREVTARLGPVFDHLAHLWAPAAHVVDETLVDLWHALDRGPGLSYQWQVNVDRIRDQMIRATLELLEQSRNH